MKRERFPLIGGRRKSETLHVLFAENVGGGIRERNLLIVLPGILTADKPQNLKGEIER